MRHGWLAVVWVVSGCGGTNPGNGAVEWTEVKNVPADLADGDQDTTYAAGAGVTLAGGTFSASFSGQGGELGTATSVARADHLHDTRYPLRTELSAAGAINGAGNPLAWTQLKDVPAGFADGVDNVGSAYALGDGLALDGGTMSVSYAGQGGDLGAATDVSRADHRHDVRYATRAELVAVGTLNGSSNPVDWTQLKGVPAALADGADDVGPSYTAGAGLQLAAGQFAAQFAGQGGDFGTTDNLCRADHAHDARYPTLAALGAVGTVNAAANPVDWTQLKGVPGGLADGVDSDTLYSPGAGLSLVGTTFSANFTVAGGDSGSATTVARGDHLHDGRYPIQAGRPGGQVIYGGTGAGEDLVLRSTTSATRGELYLGDDGSWVSIGGGLPSAPLDVNGEIRHNAVLKVGAAAPVAYETSTLRYIVEAPPSSVGVVVPLDNAIVDLLCRDRDGCKVRIGMVNWDQPGQPGAVANREAQLFISETSRWWRFNDAVGEPSGADGANGVQEISSWDCYLGDAETYTGTPNGRADATVGWGLLNCAGCSYSDATTTCRVVIED